MEKNTPEPKKPIDATEGYIPEDHKTIPPNALRIECVDGCKDYIEIVFDNHMQRSKER